MTQANFEAVTRQALADHLPDCNDVLTEARQIADTITIGRTAAFDTWGVASEAEFKRCLLYTSRCV